jgi:hypothetical protein
MMMLDDREYPELQFTRTRKARKQHTCADCGEPIEVGTRYIEIRYLLGAFRTYRIHLACDERA